LGLDQFLDSQCQSRLSHAWWRSISHEKGVIQVCQLRPIGIFTTSCSIEGLLTMCPLFGTREACPVRRALSPAQALEMLRVPQPLTPRLGHRGALSGARVLPGPTDGEDLCGFLPRRRPASGWEAKREASRLRRLAHSVVLGHPQERCESIGAAWQADVIEPKSRSGCQRDRTRGATRLAPCG
jgi:hypothetical protein